MLIKTNIESIYTVTKNIYVHEKCRPTLKACNNINYTFRIGTKTE